MSLKRKRSEEVDIFQQLTCGCAKLVKDYEESRGRPWPQVKNQYDGPLLFNEPFAIPHTWEICFDEEMQLGNLPAFYESEHSLDPTKITVSPFVLCLGFSSSRGMDQKNPIKAVAKYFDQEFRRFRNETQPIDGMIVTRDAGSLYIRMACRPELCDVCGECKSCRARLPAIDTLIENLWALGQRLRERQMDPKTGQDAPYPKTNTEALKQLTAQVLGGFHMDGVHGHHAIVPKTRWLHAKDNGRLVLASTSDSAPYPGVVYQALTQNIKLPRWASALPQHRSSDCTVCFEPTTKVPLMELSCGCVRCIECMENCFKSALGSRQTFPPKCCGRVLSLHEYAKYLNPDVVQKYLAVADEYKEINPMYCAKPGCCAFIRSTLIEDSTAICPKCLEQTCVKCRKLESCHQYCPRRTCPTEEEEERRLNALAKARRWKPCPRCHAIVERVDGCGYMVCLCGQEFCYRCGSTYQDEDRECGCDGAFDWLLASDSEGDEQE